MTSLGVLYPPCGAEFEYYQFGERLSSEIRIKLVGVRIYGGDDEHAPEHLSRTGEIGNLTLSARVLKHVRPDTAVWACTSGSFVDGLAHAHAQIDALSKVLECPVTSTSLAFLAALERIGVNRVAVLASYPEQTAARFFSFLEQGGIATHAYECLDIDSGPAAATLEWDRVSHICSGLEIPADAALVLPDTAIPAMRWIEKLENELDRTVLTANQVSLWHAAHLANVSSNGALPGRLLAA